VYFVPESKLGSELLREMQKNNIRMAIVVDEYGGVAGLVTIEDLVEEIVGEIADEHEKAEVVRENDHSYIVPGNMDVDRLDQLLGTRPEGKESATVAGLVSELAGRIPQKGDVIEDDGLRFEVLESTERRVQRVRISAVEPKQMRLIEKIILELGNFHVNELPNYSITRFLNSYGLSLRIRLHPWASQRRQVHVAECPGGRETGHHQPQAPDYAQPHSGNCPDS